MLVTFLGLKSHMSNAMVVESQGLATGGAQTTTEDEDNEMDSEIDTDEDIMSTDDTKETSTSKVGQLIECCIECVYVYEKRISIPWGSLYIVSSSIHLIAMEFQSNTTFL